MMNKFYVYYHLDTEDYNLQAFNNLVDATNFLNGMMLGGRGCVQYVAIIQGEIILEKEIQSYESMRMGVDDD